MVTLCFRDQVHHLIHVHQAVQAAVLDVVQAVVSVEAVRPVAVVSAVVAVSVAAVEHPAVQAEAAADRCQCQFPLWEHSSDIIRVYRLKTSS